MVNSEVQSILFDRRLFTPQQATDWLLSHHFRVYKLDITKKYLRFRQFPPNRNLYRYRTKQIANGIKFIFAFPKKISMSVVSNPLIFEALFGGLEEKSTVDNVSSALSPEPVVKAGQYIGNLGTLSWNQIRYTVTYGIFQFIFTISQKLHILELLVVVIPILFIFLYLKFQPTLISIKQQKLFPFLIILQIQQYFQ